MVPASDSPGRTMAKSIICSSVLAAFLWFVKSGLYQLADTVEFSSFALICCTLMALTVAAAFGWDWHEARSRR
jgi:hypothetical protein